MSQADLTKINVMMYLMYFDAVKNSFLPMLNNDVNNAQLAGNWKEPYIGNLEIDFINLFVK